MASLEDSLANGGELVPFWRTILWVLIAYLVALGLVVLWRPLPARGFLAGFAADWRKNLLEAALRGVAGLAFIGAASTTRLPEASRFIGLFLIATALLMALLPRIHRLIASRSTNAVFEILPLFGLLSLCLAALVAWFII